MNLFIGILLANNHLEIHICFSEVLENDEMGDDRSISPAEQSSAY